MDESDYIIPESDNEEITTNYKTFKASKDLKVLNKSRKWKTD